MTTIASVATIAPPAFAASLDYVTLTIADQLFGLPIDRVHDVFNTRRLTRVPGAPAEIVGLLNLRGRVVTALCLRSRLGQEVFPFRDGESERELTAVGVDYDGESYALIVDRIGEVMRLQASGFEAPPINLDRRWAGVAAGIHRLDDRLLVVLDLDAVLRIDIPAAA